MGARKQWDETPPFKQCKETTLYTTNFISSKTDLQIQRVQTNCYGYRSELKEYCSQESFLKNILENELQAVKTIGETINMKTGGEY